MHICRRYSHSSFLYQNRTFNLFILQISRTSSSMRKCLECNFSSPDCQRKNATTGEKPRRSSECSSARSLTAIRATAMSQPCAIISRLSTRALSLRANSTNLKEKKRFHSCFCRKATRRTTLTLKLLRKVLRLRPSVTSCQQKELLTQLASQLSTA